MNSLGASALRLLFCVADFWGKTFGRPSPSCRSCSFFSIAIDVFQRPSASAPMVARLSAAIQTAVAATLALGIAALLQAAMGLRPSVLRSSVSGRYWRANACLWRWSRTVPLAMGLQEVRDAAPLLGV